MKNNPIIAFNVLYAKEEKLYPAYVSKHKSNREKEIILLMIFNGKGLHYITVKIFSSLLKGNTSKHHSDFYCLNCFHSFRTENKLESHKKLCENKYFCIIVKPSEDAWILNFIQYQKSDKAPFIIYENLKSCYSKDWWM